MLNEPVYATAAHTWKHQCQIKNPWNYVRWWFRTHTLINLQHQTDAPHCSRYGLPMHSIASVDTFLIPDICVSGTPQSKKAITTMTPKQKQTTPNAGNASSKLEKRVIKEKDMSEYVSTLPISAKKPKLKPKVHQDSSQSSGGSPIKKKVWNHLSRWYYTCQCYLKRALAFSFYSLLR